jgi:hypothetical protein
MSNKELLIKEIDTLPPAYVAELVDFVAWLQQKRRKVSVLERAAALARDEYLGNKELTAFSVLDGEAFSLLSNQVGFC